MLINEQSELEGFYVSDAVAVRRLQKDAPPRPPHQEMLHKMIQQNAKLARDIEVLAAQLAVSQEQVKNLQKAATAKKKPQVRFVYEAKDPAPQRQTPVISGNSYAARMRAKRF